MKTPTWRTRDGQEIPVRDLSNSHLLNIYRMLLRVIEEHCKECLADAYVFASTCRGDGAIDAIESEIACIENADEDDIIQREFPAIHAEMDRRDLWCSL